MSRTLTRTASLLALVATPLLGQAAGLDPNTFIVGHPASPRWTAAPVQHANGEHPAVLQARAARAAHIDGNTFLVQPPAATRWLAVAPRADVQLAAAETAVAGLGVVAR